MQLEQIATAKAMEEYDRLLYVAMTRACDRLYVAGTVPRGGDAKPGTWYERIRSALADRLTPFTYADGFTVSRFDGEGSAVTPDKDAAEAPRVSPLPAPGWAQEPAPSEPAATNWRAPSHVGRQAEATATETVWPADPATARRYRRGNLIHSLLQYLPDLAPDRRATAARDWLTTILPAGADNEVADITHEIMSLLTMPGFAAIFGPGSQAEVPLAALLGEEGLTGRIDRLLIGADEILALDYKTNRPPPDRLEAVPAAYIAQMAAYRAALGLIFPGRTIRTALIWTHGARFMEIPGP
jgi:ATP-dependent helicase/nuclease subunit A